MYNLIFGAMFFEELAQDLLQFGVLRTVKSANL